MSVTTVAVREKPILFSGEMVQAILDGRKTQTRRIVKAPHLDWLEVNRYPAEYVASHCPYGKTGDRLWVRENWRDGGNGRTLYQATSPDLQPLSGLKWKPSIHMKRSDCRILLTIKNIRVELLQNISESDAVAEGIKWQEKFGAGGTSWTPSERSSHKNTFSILWDEINGKKHPWASNPWVWVIEFAKDGEAAPLST